MSETIGRYTIIKEIGSGPVTAVFQAYDPHFEQPVAIKIVRPGLMNNVTFITRFKKNAKTLVRLQHQHIVPMYDFGEFDGRLALIMKWMAGGSLTSLLGSPLPFEQTAQFIIQTSEGLTFASQGGLIHGHLHPGNILFDEDGNIAVADIGLTQMLGDSSFGPSLGDADMEQSAYTAPEIWQGEASTKSSDVYALGCLLFELVTGNKLFQANNPAQAMQLHQQSPPFPDQWPDQTPPEILPILQQAVAQDPAQRYAEARNLANDLAGLVKTWRKRYFGDYEVLEEIGVGGFAEVFRAYDRVNQREVALKLILPFRMTDEDTRRFYREAKTVSNLSHPHIVPVYAHGELNGRFYLVMELFRGGTLENLLRVQGHFSLLQTATIIQDVAAGLAYAHQQNLIHRDIKPANVLLDENGRAVLADFGVVKALEHSTITMTTSGGIMGTPAYIAPEIWSGKEATHAVDTYALGCMVYEMLTGEQLHNAPTLPAIIAKHLKPPEFPENWMEDVPPDLVGILSVAMHQEPTKRYATVSDFSIALLKVADPLFEDYQSLESAMQNANWVQAMRLAENILAQDAAYKDAAAYLAQTRQQQAEVERQAVIAQVRADVKQATSINDWAAVLLAAKRWRELESDDNNCQAVITHAEWQQKIAQLRVNTEMALTQTQWTTAMDLAQEWVNLAPDDAIAPELLAQAQAGKAKEGQIQSWRTTIETAVTHSQWQTVLAIAQQWQVEEPNSVEAANFIEAATIQLEVASIREEVETAVAQEAWAQTITLCQRWLALIPEDPDAQVMLAQAEATQVEKNALLHWQTKTQQAQQQKQWSVALAAAQEWQKLDPTNPDILAIITDAERHIAIAKQQTRAEKSLTKKRWQEAIDTAQAWLQLAPGDPTAQDILAQAQAGQQRAAAMPPLMRKIPKWTWGIGGIILVAILYWGGMQVMGSPSLTENSNILTSANAPSPALAFAENGEESETAIPTQAHTSGANVAAATATIAPPSNASTLAATPSQTATRPPTSIATTTPTPLPKRIAENNLNEVTLLHTLTVDDCNSQGEPNWLYNQSTPNFFINDTSVSMWVGQAFVCAFEARSGNRLYEKMVNFPYDYVDTLTISPDGSMIAVTFYQDSYQLLLWDLAANSIVMEAPLDKQTNHIGWASDSRLFATADWNGRVRVWSAETGVEIRDFKTGVGGGPTLGWSPDNEIVAVGGNNSTIEILDVAANENLRTFSGHESRITAISWSPDGTKLASSSGDSIRVWDTTYWDQSQGQQLAMIPNTNLNPVSDLAWAADSQLILSGHYNGQISIWDATTGELTSEIDSQQGRIYFMQMSPVYSYFISAGEDETLKIWGVGD